MSDEPPVLYTDLGMGPVAVVLAAFAVLVGVTALAHAAARPLTWLIVGTLIALALNPIVARLEIRVHRRSAAVGIVLAGMVAGVALLVLLFVPPAIHQGRHLADDLPHAVHDLGRLPLIGRSIRQAGVSERIQSFLDDLPDQLSGNTALITQAAKNALTGALGVIMTIVIAITALLDGPRLVERLRRLVPGPHRRTGDRIGAVIYRTVGRYFAGSVLLAGISGVIVAAVALGLGVPLAPLLGAWVAMFDLIPQIGGAVGGVPFVIFGFTRGAGTGLACVVFFVVYLNVKHHVIQPIVIGRSVHLSPLATMIAALVGISAGGLVGAVIAVPLLGTVKTLYNDLRTTPPPSDATPA